MMLPEILRVEELIDSGLKIHRRRGRHRAAEIKKNLHRKVRQLDGFRQQRLELGIPMPDFEYNKKLTRVLDETRSVLERTLRRIHEEKIQGEKLYEQKRLEKLRVRRSYAPKGQKKLARS